MEPSDRPLDHWREQKRVIPGRGDRVSRYIPFSPDRNATTILQQSATHPPLNLATITQQRLGGVDITEARDSLVNLINSRLGRDVVSGIVPK